MSDSKSKYDLASLTVDSKSSSENTKKNKYSFITVKNTEEFRVKNSSVMTPRATYSTPASVGYYFPDEIAYRWYIQAGAGAQLLMAEDDDKGPFADRITFAPALTGGYRWNPIFGVRLNVTGGSLHGHNDGHSGTYRFWKGKSDEFKTNYAK